MRLLAIKHSDYYSGTEFADLTAHKLYTVIPLPIVMEALEKSGTFHLYECSHNASGADFTTILSVNVHTNGSDSGEWVGGTCDGDYVLSEHLQSNGMYHLDEMSSANSCGLILSLECEPNERSLRKALREKGWEIIPKIPTKYLST